MRHATMLVAILAFVPASATAQAPPPVKVGDRVRVTAPDVGRREGTVQLLTTDSLVIRPEYGAWPVQLLTTDSLVMQPEYGEWTVYLRRQPNPLAIPLASVTRLEVSRGRKSRVGRGAGIGLLGGGLLGLTISSVVLARNNGCTGQGFVEPTRGGCIALATVGGAVVGTLLGLVVGAMASTDKWKAVSLLRVAPQRDGRFGLGLSVRF